MSQEQETYERYKKFCRQVGSPALDFAQWQKENAKIRPFTLATMQFNARTRKRDKESHGQNLR